VTKGRGLVLGLLVILGAVGVHDAYCHYVHFDRSVLCRRADGSLWRDPSSGCTGGEDPRCRYAPCEDSERVSEGWRHACSWVILEAEVPPSGPPPHYDGPSPGRGLPGRAG
jgi:hypothetical protein